jgi:hypothetical protein
LPIWGRSIRERMNPGGDRSAEICRKMSRLVGRSSSSSHRSQGLACQLKPCSYQPAELRSCKHQFASLPKAIKHSTKGRKKMKAAQLPERGKHTQNHPKPVWASGDHTNKTLPNGRHEPSTAQTRTTTLGQMCPSSLSATLWDRNTDLQRQRKSPPAGNKTRCNGTHKPQSKATQRKTKPNQKPQPCTSEKGGHKLLQSKAGQGHASGLGQRIGM